MSIKARFRLSILLPSSIAWMLWINVSCCGASDLPLKSAALADNCAADVIHANIQTEPIIHPHATGKLSSDVCHILADEGRPQNGEIHGSSQDNNDHMEGLVEDMMQWIRSTPGSYISDKIAVRRHTAATHASFGVFATQDIDEDEVLFTIPSEIILQPNTTTTAHTNPDHEYCGILQTVHDALHNPRTPYDRYLRASHQPGFLPALWSRQGKEMMHQLAAETLVPADYDLERHCDVVELCGHSEAAWQLVTSRADDIVMVPLYDLLSHANGRRLNTRHDETFFRIVAARQIRDGDEITTSYNQCTACGGRHWTFGTPHLFRDYGFVEAYPQRFVLLYGRLIFDVTEDMEIVLHAGGSMEGIVAFVEDELRGLQEFAEGPHPKHVPKGEWNAIWELHGAYVTAFTLLSEYLAGM